MRVRFASVLLGVVLGGVVLPGCSNDKNERMALPGDEQIAAWLVKQDWKVYKDRSTLVESDGVTYGVGIARQPKCAALREANKKRVRVLALKALPFEIEGEASLSKVTKVVDSEFVTSDGNTNAVFVVATVLN